MNVSQKIELKIKAGKYDSLGSALSGIARFKHVKGTERQRMAAIAREYFAAKGRLNGDAEAESLAPVTIEKDIDDIMQRVLRAALKTVGPFQTRSIR